MPFNGSGVFQRVRNWVADATAGIKIRADYHDAEDDGFAAGLTNCITKDGQTVVTQNIPWNSKRITGLADPINPQDAATLASITAKFGSSGTLTGTWSVTGALTVTGLLTANGGEVVNGTLTVNGSENISGNLQVGGEIGITSNILRFGAVGSSPGYLVWNGGGSYTLGSGGTVWHTGNLNPGSYQPVLGFTPVRQGGGPAQTADQINIGWSAQGLRASVNNADLGTFVFGSGNYIANGRLAMAGDTTTLAYGNLATGEPFAGSVITGFGSNYSAGYPIPSQFRSRYLQLFTTGWFTVGYVG